MRYFINLIIRKSVFLAVIGFVGLIIGCQGAVDTTTLAEPVFYPPPPAAPKLQFLTSFSSGADLGPRKSKFSLEDFVLGAPEKREDITTPYGVAIHDGKIYVCDVGSHRVHVLDLVNRTFDSLPEDKRLRNPVNLDIDEEGNKYVADNGGGGIFVYNSENQLINVLVSKTTLIPRDIAVRGQFCYLTDISSQQVIVLDKKTGEIVKHIGQRSPGPTMEPGDFVLISDLALDEQGNIYVTDRVSGRITKFDPSGELLAVFARLGTGAGALVRAKGIALDKENRIWVVDTATVVAKIYSNEGQILLYFGGGGSKPGDMAMPATIWIDYDNVDLFRQYAVPGAELEFIVLVTNQYSSRKVNVYGFGTFPEVSKPASSELTDQQSSTEESDSKTNIPPIEPSDEKAKTPDSGSTNL